MVDPWEEPINAYIVPERRHADMTTNAIMSNALLLEGVLQDL